MEDEKRDTHADFCCRVMLGALDLAYPTDGLKNDKAKNEKWFLRKRILDYVHKIDFLNKEE